jgi:hypothetical protein
LEKNVDPEDIDFGLESRKFVAENFATPPSIS